MILGSLLCICTAYPARLSTGFSSTHPAFLPLCLPAWQPGSLAHRETYFTVYLVETGSCRWPGGLARSGGYCLLAFEIRSFLACPGCLGGSKTDPARGFLKPTISWSLASSPTHNTIPGTHVLVRSDTAGPGQGPRSTEAQWVVSAAQRREPLPSSSFSLRGLQVSVTTQV